MTRSMPYRGKVSGKSGMTMRIKVYKNDDGHIIKYGPQEYFHRDKRDYKRSPRTAAEASQADFWRMVCREKLYSIGSMFFCQ